MKSRIFRMLAVSMATVLFSTGCLMSRLVDRAFLGITVRRPTYIDRKTTGVFLLPFTFVVDVATFPIQAILIVILGDNFPWNDPPDALTNMHSMLETQPRFQQLGEAEQKIAAAELKQLIVDKKLTANTALALNEDGHWTVVELSADTRNQLIARAQQPQAPDDLVCAR